jgi:hypothetical protein
VGFKKPKQKSRPKNILNQSKSSQCEQIRAHKVYTKLNGKSYHFALHAIFLRKRFFEKLLSQKMHEVYFRRL